MILFGYLLIFGAIIGACWKFHFSSHQGFGVFLLFNAVNMAIVLATREVVVETRKAKAEIVSAIRDKPQE